MALLLKSGNYPAGGLGTIQQDVTGFGVIGAIAANLLYLDLAPQWIEQGWQDFVIRHPLYRDDGCC